MTTITNMFESCPPEVQQRILYDDLLLANNSKNYSLVEKIFELNNLRLVSKKIHKYITDLNFLNRFYEKNTKNIFDHYYNMEGCSEMDKVNILCEFYEVQCEMKKPKMDKMTTIQLAKEIATQLQNVNEKHKAFKQILSTLIEQGDYQEAYKVIPNIGQFDLSHQLFVLAHCQFRAGEIAEARITIEHMQRVIEGIQDGDEKACRQLELIELLVDGEELESASKRIADIDHANARAEARLKIIKGLVKKGDIERAKELVSDLADPSKKVRANMKIIKGLLKNGEIDEAIEIATHIDQEYPREKSKALSEIVLALLKNGNDQRVAEITLGVEDLITRIEIQLVIAKFKIEDNKSTEASDICKTTKVGIENVQNLEEKMKFLLQLIEVQADAGDIAETEKNIKEMTVLIQKKIAEKERVEKWLEIAQLQLKTKDTEGAKESYELAISTTKRIKKYAVQAELFLKIAMSQFQSGNAKEVLPTINEASFATQMVYDQDKKNRLKFALVKAQLTLEDINGALRMAASICSDDELKARAFIDIAKKQLEKHEAIEKVKSSLDKAEEFVKKIEEKNSREKLALLCEICELRVRIKDIKNSENMLTHYGAFESYIAHMKMLQIVMPHLGLNLVI